MPEGSYQYCDVSLPVPVDQLFTYSLPETLRHRVQPGSRIVVPFGPRKLTGVILRCHDDRPEVATRDALRLIDEAAPRWPRPMLNSPRLVGNLDRDKLHRLLLGVEGLDIPATLCVTSAQLAGVARSAASLAASATSPRCPSRSSKPWT